MRVCKLGMKYETEGRMVFDFFVADFNVSEIQQQYMVSFIQGARSLFGNRKSD